MRAVKGRPRAQHSPRRGGRPRAIVHIGLNKSGSTTIQGWLTQNRAALAAQGIVYDPFDDQPIPALQHAIGFTTLAAELGGRLVRHPQARAYHRMETPEAQSARVAEFLARAEPVIAAGDFRTFVISSEFLPFWIGPPKSAGLLHDWLSERFARVRYVVYVRDQVLWAPSAYTQHIKMGGTDDLAQFLNKGGERNYFAICDRWLSGVGRGKLSVRALEPSLLKDGDLIADFADVIGADASQTAPPDILNESIDAASVARLREINRTTAKLPEALASKMRGDKVAKLLGSTSGEKLRLTPEQAIEVAQRNAKSNERLRRRFFPDQEVLFPTSHALLAAAAEAPSE